MDADRSRSHTAERLASRALRHLPAFALRSLGGMAGAAASLAFRPAGRAAWQALADKIDVFRHYEHAARRLRLPRGALGVEAVPPLLERARRHGSLRSVWLIEGLGRELGRRHLEAAGELPRGLLRHAADRLPPAALLPLHLGLGLFLAEHSLRDYSLRDYSLPRSDIAAGSDREPGLDTALRDFARACRQNAADGFAEVSAEPLGLIARLLHPELVDDVGGILRREDETRWRTFRHGVGRALYFAPSLSAPLPRWTARRRLQELARFDGDPSDVVAGLMQARVLVNLRRPAVVCAELAADRQARADGFGDRPSDGDEDRYAARDAVRRGAESALAVWRRVSGDVDAGHDAGERFLAYRPEEPDLRRLWTDLVVEPGERGLRGPDRDGPPGPLFRAGPETRTRPALRDLAPPGVASCA